MKILIVGGGGREHALAWAAAKSGDVEKVYVAPGNAGTANEPRCENVAISAGDLDGLIGFAREQGVGLTIVGPEDPLVAGIVDRFAAAGLKCFGPSAVAAQLEGSKAFAKDFMARHGIPTAAYGKFTEVAPAIEFIRTHGAPIVVKADGLAAGKGVIVAQTTTQAEAAVLDMLAGNAFGDAGHRVVVDTGPNTGGMGAYSPAPVVDEAMHRRVMEEVIRPTVDGMAADGALFTGFLYAGLMISPEGEPRVLEFNVRFGDPETQPILMRLQSDLPELCLAAIEGRLDQVHANWDPRACLGVVMAAGGYPGTYDKGQSISGLDSDFPGHVKVFHAGTALADDGVVTAGGRVLCVCALGDSVSAAQADAYRACEQIQWDGAYRRSDIGYRAIDRENSSGVS